MALVLHVLLFLGMASLVAWGLLSRALQAESVPPPPPAVVVQIRAEMFERLPAPPELVPPKQGFAKTSPAQESPLAPEQAVLIGERNTQAASELLPSPYGAKVPSQDGEEPRHPDEINTFNSQFQDGEDGEVAMQPDQPESPPTGDLTLAVKEPQVLASAAAEAAEEALPPPAGGGPEKLMQTETQVPVPARKDSVEQRQTETLPKESESSSEAKEAKPSGGAPNSTPAEEAPPKKDPGFRTEMKKTRLRGSIGRRGTTALDVEDSPLGRYQAKLNRAVEREWQKNCIRYREHVLPGFLTIRFLLDAKGQVFGIRFLEVMPNGEIQQGFTLRAIQDADLPRMPKDIVKELNGDPLELIYNFYF